MKHKKDEIDDVDEAVDEEIEEEEPEEEEEVKAKPQEKKEKWGVSLVVVDERTLPQKVVVNGKTGETLDMHMALAEILNNQEKLKKLLD